MVSDLLGDGPERAIPGNFVVLHLLGRRNQHRVQQGIGRILFHCLLAFRDQTLHGGARLRLGLYIQKPENFFQPFDVPFGLFQMFLEGGLQRVVRGRFRHLGQRAY